MTEQKPTIAVIGGTGALGSGFALRWARAGYPVIIGSRATESAEKKAAEMSAILPDASIRGLENAAAAAAADIVVLTVPFSNHRPMLEAVCDAAQGKILVDATVPLVPPKVARVQLPPEGSAAKAAQDFLGDGVHVVSAFQNVAADLVQDLDATIECEVLVCGNKRAARQTVVEMAEAAGLTAWHAGPIDNSAAADALTSVLIFLNRGDISHAGIRITGERDG
ncbi:MAG: NADPH-dependent F420 reductase [Alphaproteobacteria bacterium]|nr:NADPH-dependent F420 reductase [Alphaproteobacteria bacterium]